MTGAVVVDRVVKRFGATTALAGISFSVSPGEIFGFIGPDGAGKTTLFRILTTLLVSDSGTAHVLGQDVVHDLWALRTRVGYMPGRFSLYPDLSIEENLQFFASVFGTTLAAEHERIAPIYEQLEPFRSRRAGALSGGMKQKLALCCALVHRPDILFLDEPTTGVDAVSRREFWDLLGDLKRGGLTTVVSTPYMDEAHRCDRVALIQRGTLLAVDTPRAVAQMFGQPLIAVRAERRNDALRALRAYRNTGSAYPFGSSIHFSDRRTDVPAETQQTELRTYLEAQGLEHASVELTAATVEDTFMARMGGDRPDGSAR
jgi:ABC-2 type transport system ATP-binding protein